MTAKPSAPHTENDITVAPYQEDTYHDTDQGPNMSTTFAVCRVAAPFHPRLHALHYYKPTVNNYRLFLEIP